MHRKFSLPFICVFVFLACARSGFAAEIQAELNYPYLSDVTKEGSDFWTSHYIGVAGIGGTFYFNMPKNFDLGLGAGYTLARLRSNDMKFSDLQLHRIALKGRIVYRFEPAHFISIRPYLGNDIALLDWTGTTANLSGISEKGIGITCGISVPFLISKSFRIGPDISYTYHRRLVDTQNLVSGGLTYLQTGVVLSCTVR